MSLDAYYMPSTMFRALVTKSDLDAMCVHAVEKGGHELQINVNETPYAQIGSDLWSISPRESMAGEMDELVRNAFGDRRMASAHGGEPQDFSYSVKTGRNQYIRFRVNVTAGYRKGDGLCIVMRHIPTNIPDVEDIDIPPVLLRSCTELRDGLVMVSGVTGTGKSTTLASLIKHRLTTSGESEKFCSAEAPVEFLHDYDTPKPCTIQQLEVGSKIPTFEAAVRNILRKSSSIFLLGEARDKVTIEALMHAVDVGPLCFSTCHARSVSETIPRLIGTFPREARDAALSSIVAATRVYVAQTLLKVKGKPGKRVACREILVVTPEIRRELEKYTPETIELGARAIVAESGISMIRSAELLHEGDLIDDEALSRVRRQYG